MSEHFDSYREDPQAQVGTVTAPVPAESPAADAEIVLSPDMTQALTSELVQKLIEIEKAKPELIKKLLAQRAETAQAAKDQIAKAKTAATEADTQLVESLRALGWRRPRQTKPKDAQASAPKKKRGRPKKTGTASAAAPAQPAGEVEPAGTEN